MPDCVLPRVQGGGGSVVVLGGFSFDGKMALTFLEGRLTGIRYRNEIVMKCILPHIQAHPDWNMVLVQDNAPMHNARVTQEALQEHEIPRMDRPANSPDLNIIEDTWDMIGRAIEEHESPS